jgi:Ricin-type beta-trefoil lectin domain-like
MTGPQRDARRHERKSRAPRLWVFGAAGVAVAAAVAVAVTLVASGNTPASSRPTPLATNITSDQSVGLANLGPPPAGGAAAGTAILLSQSGEGLRFTTGSGGDTVRPAQQWQADQMGGGAYILVYTPDGKCLSAAGSRHRAVARLSPCNLGLSQRWAHPYLGTDSSGRGYYQLRSVATGRCLAAGRALPGGGAGVTMQSCSSSMPWPQLITFFTAF